MEFGPRQVGARFNIGRCKRNYAVFDELENQIRESFRPFAPAVLMEDLCKYLELHEASTPYAVGGTCR